MEVPLILNISHYSILLPFLLGIITIKHQSESLKFLAGLIILGTFVEFVSTIFNTSNHWMMNIYDIFEFIFFLIIIYKFNDLPKIKSYLFSLISIYILFRIFLLLAGIESIFNFKSYSQILTHIILITLSLTNLIIIGKRGEHYLLKKPKFWILSAIALYFSATFLLTFSTLVFGNVVLVEMYEIHGYVNTICNLIFAYSFLLQYKISKFDLAQENF